MYIYPPTSLSVERVRRRHQPANPSATNLTPLNSLRSSAIQPASTPNLVAASLQARRLAYYLLKGTELRRERLPQGATGCHRLPQPATGRPTLWPLRPLKPRSMHLNPSKTYLQPYKDQIFKVPELRTSLFGPLYY